MAAGLKQKTHKVLEMSVEGFKFICIVHYEQTTNPFHLYLKWYDGQTHMKQLARYGNFISVIEHIRNWMHAKHIGFDDGIQTP